MRFRLRTLLVIGLCAALVFAAIAWKREQTRRQEIALKKISGVGFAEWRYGNVVGLWRGDRFTDAQASGLKSLPYLRELGLEYTAITDNGMSEIASLPRLEILWLYDKKISLAGLIKLKEARKLKRLTVDLRHISDAELTQLRNALPNCAINRR